MRRFLVTVALALAPSASCAGPAADPSVYLHPNADFSLYQRVALLPLENLSTERFAAERIRELLFVELSALEYFELVESGEVNRVLRAKSIANTTELGPAEIQELGTALGAQALLSGSVIEFREQREGTLTSPEIALSLRLIDVETGLVIWSVTDARAGLAVITRLFGVGEQDQTSAARALIRDLLSTLG